MDEATAQAVMALLNEDSMSPLAWARFYGKLSWAEKAEVTALDLECVTLVASTLKGKRRKQIKLAFDPKLETPGDVKPAVVRMREEATWIRWPPGAAPWLVVVAMAVAVLMAFWPEDKGLGYLNPLRDLTMRLFGSQAGVKLALALGQAAHTFEALLTLRMGHVLGLRAKWGWAALAFAIGFPAMQEVAVLHRASKAAKAKNA